MLRGRAHIALLVQTYPPFSLSSHSCTHMHTDTQGCRKAHTERHSPPLCSLPSSCCFPPPRSCLCMSQEVMSKIITGLLHQRRNKVLFYWEPITDNSQISLSLMKMYACTQPALIVLIRRKGACTCPWAQSLYVQYVCERTCVCVQNSRWASVHSSETSAGYLLHIHVFPHMWPSSVNKEY